LYLLDPQLESNAQTHGVAVVILSGWHPMKGDASSSLRFVPWHIQASVAIYGYIAMLMIAAACLLGTLWAVEDRVIARGMDADVMYVKIGRMLVARCVLIGLALPLAMYLTTSF
jgi:hypothetical protein